MKNKKLFTKQIILIVAVVLAIVGAGVGTTVALLKSSTEKLVNTFEVGSIETELVEVVTDTAKKPYVVNVGKNDCYIRIRASVSPSDMGSLDEVVDGLDTTKWVDGGDGYYYYKDPVAPFNRTSKPLFEGVKAMVTDNSGESEVNSDLAGKSFDIVLYQEAVQATVTYELNGKTVTTTDMDEIWTFYTGKTVNTKNTVNE